MIVAHHVVLRVEPQDGRVPEPNAELSKFLWQIVEASETELDQDQKKQFFVLLSEYADVLLNLAQILAALTNSSMKFIPAVDKPRDWLPGKHHLNLDLFGVQFSLAHSLRLPYRSLASLLS